MSRRFRLQYVAALAAAFFLLQSNSATADATSEKLKERGTITFGVILSGPPYGYIDPTTKEERGFNVDLAREIGRRLDLKVALVQVTPPNRVQFLQQGKVDALIANMEWTAERAEILSFAPTPFFKVGGAALTRKSAAIKQWSDLKGKPVCASQGSNYAKPLTEEFGAQVRGYPSQPESLLALKGGNCVAAVHVSGTLRALLKDRAEEWQDFELPLATDLIPSDGVVWVRKGEADIQARIDAILKELHGSGFILGIAEKNGLVIDDFLRETNARFKS
ncbi:transporter substrate-binding domain-containing protein [Bradyrhizobium sp. SZCCHNPS2010]|uniref:transporter substrate-binding domain-containing protein n=1 Tax=Bradyrhizobium sp. SZCCHNPS2010 TaxID=3057333 RepID=UPI003966DC72